MTTRIYYPESLEINTTISLTARAHQHLNQVMRAKAGESFILFNGDGYQYTAIFEPISRHKSQALIQSISKKEAKPALTISLACSIIKKERMSYLIEKATELGVDCIYPLITERSNIKLKMAILEKNKLYWEKVAIAACEQSGRCYLPKIEMPILLNDWLVSHQNETTLLLSQFSNKKLQNHQIKTNKINILSGAEGGFSDSELAQIKSITPFSIKIADHVLRAETAPIAAIAICHHFLPT